MAAAGDASGRSSVAACRWSELLCCDLLKRCLIGLLNEDDGTLLWDASRSGPTGALARVR